MGREGVYNFSAGPSALPAPVLERAKAELLDYNGTGVSVMEMSHRSKPYMEIFASVKAKLTEALSIPDTHGVLFLQGGATLQFAAVPMNLMTGGKGADYAVTGNFSAIAAREAEKYCGVRIAADTGGAGHTYIPEQGGLTLDPDASYFYYCANNTIYGTEWKYTPDTGKVPLVSDMSSNILSMPLDVSRFGLIFAGAQKNMAPAGLTAVIIRKSLAGNARPDTPIIMNYKTMLESDSMFNTPPCYCIYMLGLMLDWLKSEGGVAAMQSQKKEKSALLYDILDNSVVFSARARRESRSDMNVTFSTGDKDADERFVKEAQSRGLLGLAGHRITGGIRASLYNAVPLEGVKALAEFMKSFERSV